MHICMHMQFFPVYGRNLHIFITHVHTNVHINVHFYLTVCGSPIAVGLLDYYHDLAKAQHGANKVNLLPWEFYDIVSQLAGRLELMSKSGTYKVWKN